MVFYEVYTGFFVTSQVWRVKTVFLPDSETCLFNSKHPLIYLYDIYQKTTHSIDLYPILTLFRLARENNPKNEKIPRKTLYCIVQPIDGTFGGDQQTREYSVIEIAKTAVQYMLDHGRIEFDLPQATKEKLKRSNRHPLRGIMKTKQQPIRLQGACEEHKRKHQKCTEDCVKRNKKTRTDEEDNMIINSTTS